MLLIGTRDLLPLDSTCRCSRRKQWNSAFAGSILDPLTQPSSSSLSSSCPKSWKAEQSSPTMTISGQKQLIPCPTRERAPTLDRMVLTRSSRKQRLSLRNFFRRKLQFVLSRDDNRRVFQEMLFCDRPKARMIWEHVGLPLLYHGKSLLPFTFCSNQYTNRESSSECQMAIIGTPRVRFDEIVCN